MGLMRKLARSADLSKGLADRLGVDMTTALGFGDEAQARALREVVVKCSHCSDQDACASLQAENPQLDAAPSYCRNADIMRSRNR